MRYHDAEFVAMRCEPIEASGAEPAYANQRRLTFPVAPVCAVSMTADGTRSRRTPRPAHPPDTEVPKQAVTLGPRGWRFPQAHGLTPGPALSTPGRAKTRPEMSL